VGTQPVIDDWAVPVAPYDGESLSHYLGRYRRANTLSASMLGRLTGLGGVIARWEKLYHNPFPTRHELQALGAVVDIHSDRLAALLPPPDEDARPAPIRLCGACYAVEPCHRIAWQFTTARGCGRCRRRLLSECPDCGARFPYPAVWAAGCCARCGLPYAAMAARQKPL